jgi:hypothetical protein
MVGLYCGKGAKLSEGAKKILRDFAKLDKRIEDLHAE